MDNYDWPYILYVGRIWLQYSEESLWELTARQFRTQMAVHVDVQRRMNGVQKQPGKGHTDVYIDDIPGF